METKLNSDEDIDPADVWEIVREYFNDNGFVKQQLKSFDMFIKHTLQEIILERPEIIVRPNRDCNMVDIGESIEKIYKLHLNQVWLSRPTVTEADQNTRLVYPNECRLRNLTYALNVQVDISMSEITKDLISGDIIEESKTEFPRQFIGRVPIMLKSLYCSLSGENDMDLCGLGECQYDQGGYFIVDGSEKVIISQEREADNHVFVFTKPNGSKYSHTAEIRSTLNKSNRSVSYICVKLRSEPRINGDKFGTITLTIPKLIDPDIPLFVVFKSLGLTTDREILECIVYGVDKESKDEEMMNALKASVEHATEFRTQSEANEYLGSRSIKAMQEINATYQNRIDFAEDILCKSFLPHLGTTRDKSRIKAFYLGYMVNKLLLVALGRKSEDDRDHLANKRLELAGTLMSKLFRMLFYDLRKDTYRKMQKLVDQGRIVDPRNCIDSNKITNGLRYSFLTGNWGRQGGELPSQPGVSQILQRLTYVSTLSSLRRINLESGKNWKITKPRQVHNTHWGVICPAETPEGYTCGLIKNLAIMSHISVGSDSSIIFKILELFNVESLEKICLSSNVQLEVPSSYTKRLVKKCKVFVDGKWYGIHNDAEFLVKQLRELKNLVKTNNDIEIVEINEMVACAI
jgi:DNA-directed RNA polymerase II subunit RPB2